MNHLAGHGFQHRARRLQRVGLAADHEGQRAGGRALDAAGDRGIELGDAALGGLGVDVRASSTEIVEVSMNSVPALAAGSTSA